MGLKLIVLIAVVLFLTLMGLTGGAFLDVVLPNSGAVIGHGMCWIGGYIVQPVFDVGGMQLPLPVHDDIAVGLFVTMPVLLIFFRKRSWKQILIAFFIILFAVFIAYKLIGLTMVSIAENTYGMQNCVGEVSIRGQRLFDYGWYEPLFLIGLGLALFSLIAGVWKIYKWKNSRAAK